MDYKNYCTAAQNKQQQIFRKSVKIGNTSRQDYFIQFKILYPAFLKSLILINTVSYLVVWFKHFRSENIARLLDK